MILGLVSYKPLDNSWPVVFLAICGPSGVILHDSRRISFLKRTVVITSSVRRSSLSSKQNPVQANQLIDQDARVMASPKPDATEAYSMESKKAQGAMNDALSNALTTAAPWLAISSAAVYAANSYSSSSASRTRCARWARRSRSEE